MLNIYLKDMKVYFSTFLGYLYCALVLLVTGFYSYMYNFVYGYVSFEYAVNNLPFFFLFLIPIVSCGAFTEEKKRKTDQLLLTLPVRTSDIVLGKYFSLLTAIAIPMVIICAYPLILSNYGEVNFGTSYANIFSIFLLGATLVSICMFISSLLDSIIVSGIVSVGMFYLLYKIADFESTVVNSAKNGLIAWIVIALLVMAVLWLVTRNIYVGFIPAMIIVIAARLLYTYKATFIAGTLSKLLNAVALFKRLDGFMIGGFDWAALLFFLSVSAMFVVLTVFMMERRRWV